MRSFPAITTRQRLQSQGALLVSYLHKNLEGVTDPNPTDPLGCIATIIDNRAVRWVA